MGICACVLNHNPNQTTVDVFTNQIIDKPQSTDYKSGQGNMFKEIKQLDFPEKNHVIINSYQPYNPDDQNNCIVCNVQSKHEEIKFNDNQKSSNKQINYGNQESNTIPKVNGEKETTFLACLPKEISRFLDRDFINIVILGGKGVGKSAFVIKYLDNVFEKLYIPTLGSECGKKQFIFNDHPYTMYFTVTSGNDYKSDYSKAYESVDFFLAFYDVTSLDSFKEIKKILKSEVKDYLYSYGLSMTNILLVGNKIDSTSRRVPEDLAKRFCKKNNFQFFEISVKTNRNINLMMKTLVQTVDVNAFPSE